MIHSSIKCSGNYSPLFSTKAAHELIEKCLTAIEGDTPDMTSLLLTISELALLIRSANYDQHVLNNLISENEALSDELDRLKLAQITNQVAAMDMKLEKIERDCQDLQRELDIELEREVEKPEYSPFQTLQLRPAPRRLNS